jgi:hypothetical protein
LSRAVRALPVIPVSRPGSLCGVLWVVGCRWRGVASGWPRGVCELDSGCEHLDRRDLPALSGAGGVVV